MGKRYYCDYCDKMMSCAPSIIKTHNSGLLHQRAKHEHFQQFKDAETILAEETKKRPCGRFPYGKCQFGSICRYSHYSPEALQSLQKYVATKHIADNLVNQPCFYDLYKQLQDEKSTHLDDGHTVLVDENGVTHKLPWTYNAAFDNFTSLPPSVKRIKVEDFKSATFNEWG